jgi:hypothetical protein
MPGLVGCRVFSLLTMSILAKFATTVALGLCTLVTALPGQDLAPRAYVITPVNCNVIDLTYAYFSGGVLFNGTVPIMDATAKVSVPVFSFYHSLNFFGRSANFTAALPYGVGDYRGTLIGVEDNVRRSGLLDSVFRFSVNLRGGPALPLESYRKWRQKMLIGASLKVVAPSGQYDGKKLINLGSNRWAFKPEIGYSQRWGHWVLDGYGAVWFFTTNQDFFSHNQFYPGKQIQTESPVGALEGHLSYDIKPRLWVSLDGDFWYGGATSLNGSENLRTVQKNSRVGVTVSVPLTKHQSIKVSYNNGAYISFGGNYQNISVAWQYSWIGWPK